MPVADISHRVLSRGSPGITEIILWLEENVGKHYPVSCEDPVQKVGDGWEIRVQRDMIPDEGTATSWVLDITDEKKFMLYALKWGG